MALNSVSVISDYCMLCKESCEMLSHTLHMLTYYLITCSFVCGHSTVLLACVSHIPSPHTKFYLISVLSLPLLSLSLRLALLWQMDL